MSQNDYRAHNRENPEPEEGNRAVPRIVMIWIALLLIWGTGYYVWQIGKPLQAGDSRTAVQAVDATQPIDGATVFNVNCSACHQATGLGIPGAFPPLANSEWVLTDAAVSVAIVHDGLQGPINVVGNDYQGMMPVFGGILSNEEIAAVLTYVRSQWGNNASEVTTADVEKHAAKFGKRENWSASELKEVFGKP